MPLADHHSGRDLQRILVATKFRFIGDTLLAIPVIRAARARWPRARIVLLTGYNARALLEHNPLLDEIWEFDPRGRDSGLLRFAHLVQRLRQARFDACAVLNRSFHSALIPALAGIPRRAGFASEGRGLLLNSAVPYDNEKSEIDCYFDVLRALAPTISTDPALTLWLSDTERAEADSRLRAAYGDDSVPALLVGIQPGASLSEKRWPAARFAALADALALSNSALHIAIIGGPDEQQSAREMLTHCAPATLARIQNFAGCCDLRGSLALLARLSLFVGNDTAILHSANALDVPTIALFGPTNPRKWGVPAPRRRVLEAPGGAMASLPAAEAIAAAQQLLHLAPAAPDILRG